jgi:predicted Zn-dependent protease
MLATNTVHPVYLITRSIFIALLITFSTPSSGFDFGDLMKQAENFDLEKEAEKLNEASKQLDLIRGKVKQEDEVNIGRNVMSGLLGAAPLVPNKALQDYVNRIGRWVALQTSRKDLPWTFGVIDSRNVNAFAAPGGYIVLTLGLYELLENEDQLAAVLGHEISHVIEKHHLDAIRDSMRQELLGSLAVKATDRKHQENMEKLVNAGVQIYARGLDKEYEFGSDRLGVVLAARAGYDPYALLDVLTTLRSINTSDQSMTVFLNTHPPLADRLQNLDALMGRYMNNISIPPSNQRLQSVNRQIAQNN